MGLGLAGTGSFDGLQIPELGFGDELLERERAELVKVDPVLFQVTGHDVIEIDRQPHGARPGKLARFAVDGAPDRRRTAR